MWSILVYHIYIPYTRGVRYMSAPYSWGAMYTQTRRWWPSNGCCLWVRVSRTCVDLARHRRVHRRHRARRPNPLVVVLSRTAARWCVCVCVCECVTHRCYTIWGIWSTWYEVYQVHEVYDEHHNEWGMRVYHIWGTWVYGVATISRLPKNIGLLCKRALGKRRYSAKETHILKEPTNHSHPHMGWLRLVGSFKL